MNNHEESSGVDAELWIRSFTPVGTGGQQEAAVDRLRELEAAGRLDDLTVRMWNKQMRRNGPASYTEEGAGVFDAVDRFANWAVDNDRSLAPFFEERDQTCEFTGEHDSVLVLPNVALAEYADGELVHLTPHTDGDAQVTVAQRLDELAVDGTTTREEDLLAASD
jgi:hypothetical protein